MAEYAAHVTTDIEEVTDEQLDDIVDALVPVAGVPSMLGGRLSVQLTVEADNLANAFQVAMTTAVNAIMPRFSLLSFVAIVGIEVLTAEEFNRRQHLPAQAEDLVSTTEAAELLDVSRQRILQLANAYPETFPTPCRLGSRGLFWSEAALRRFASTWNRNPGPRRPASGAGSANVTSEAV